MSDLSQTRSESKGSPDTLHVEYVELQKDVETKKHELAAMRVGRLTYELTMTRSHLKREMHAVAQKMDPQHCGTSTFRLAPASFELLHDYLEGQIHLYLEASTHVMVVNSERRLLPKHLHAIDRLSAFKFPFLERNKYLQNSVQGRNPLLEQTRGKTQEMLNLYESEMSTIYDLDGAYRDHNQGIVATRDSKKRKKRIWLQNHQKKEKQTRNALKLARAKLQDFETQHGGILRNLDDAMMERTESVASLELDSAQEDREDDDVSMASLNSHKSQKSSGDLDCDMTETAADCHGVILM